MTGSYDPELDAPIAMRDNHIQRKGKGHSKMGVGKGYPHARFLVFFISWDDGIGIFDFFFFLNIKSVS